MKHSKTSIRGSPCRGRIMLRPVWLFIVSALATNIIYIFFKFHIKLSSENLRTNVKHNIYTIIVFVVFSLCSASEITMNKVIH